MFDRFIEEVSGRKASAIKNYNEELLKAKRLCEEVLKTSPDVKLQAELNEIKEVPEDSKLTDLTNIASDYNKLRSIKATLANALRKDNDINDLKSALEEEVKNARAQVSEFDKVCSTPDFKSRILSEADAVNSTIQTLEKQNHPLKEAKIEILTKVQKAYERYHKLNRVINALGNNDLLTQYYQTLGKAKDYLTANELRKMGGIGAHHARELLDRIKESDETHLSIPFAKLEARFSLLAQATCPDKNQQDYKIEMTFANVKINDLLIPYLKRSFEQLLDINFIEKEKLAEKTNLNISENKFFEKRCEHALELIKTANEYLDAAEHQLGIKKPKAPVKLLEPNETKVEAKKVLSGNQAMILTKLHAQPHVTKLGVAIANAAEPPKVLNPKNVKKDADNLAKLAIKRPPSPEVGNAPARIRANAVGEEDRPQQEPSSPRLK